jgi:GNAT acetyltransferase-like protein
MSARRVPALTDDGVSGHATSAKKELPIAESFEFVKAGQPTVALASEVANFLDSQQTSHPFQFAQWASEESYLALYRREGILRWFALCGVFYPASRVLRPIRAVNVNRGPVCDNLEIMEIGLQRLIEGARREGFARVDIVPEWYGDFSEAAGAMLARGGWNIFGTIRQSLRLGLGPAPDDLLASFRKATRYEIRRSERHNLEIRMAKNDEEREEWLQLYTQMAHDKKFPADDLNHLRRILRWLGTDPGRGGLLLAHKESKLLGGIVLVRSGSCCWYLSGATAKDEKFSAGHLLQWRGLQWAQQNGCREYDFGGYREGTSSGPAFFKRGFCDNVVNFRPASRYVVSASRQRTSELISRLRRGLASSKNQ